MTKPRWKQAFQEQMNLGSLGVLAAVSAGLLTPVPLIVGAVAEAGYLLFVPDSSWYRARVRRLNRQRWSDRISELAHDTRMLPETRDDWSRVTELRERIGKTPADDPDWFERVLDQLDHLLERYLLFARKEWDFVEMLRKSFDEMGMDWREGSQGSRWLKESVLDRAHQHYEEMLTRLRKQAEAETNDGTKQILTKRIDMIEARRETVPRIAGALRNITEQLNLIEDTFGYLSDQLQARNPAQILTDIESTVVETETMVKTLEQLSSMGI